MSAAKDAAHVLIVDDAESNRYVLSTWLRRAGYGVTEARTGDEALRVLDANSVDLAVLDVNLPDMSGYAVCERIKSDPRTAPIPVLHVSSVATQAADRSEGLRRGAEGFLTEPVEREVFIATVEALLRAAAAQQTAARLAGQLRKLNEASFAMNSAPSLHHLLMTIAAQATSLFEAPSAVAIVADRNPIAVVCAPERHPSLVPSTEHGIDELVRLATAQNCIPGPAAGALFPFAAPDSLLAAPITGFSERAGVLLVGAPEFAQVGDESAALLSQFARSAGTALRNMRSYDIERGIALMLQRNLLPDAVPEIDGLEIVTRYAASATHAEVGGDFYEMFALGRNRFAIAVGDVAGHSLEAATIMAQLRTAIRCYAMEGHTPSGVLQRLNELLVRFHPHCTATVCYAIYDAGSGQCELANAGHLPPVLRRGRSAEFLPMGGLLLGAHDQPPVQNTYAFELAHGDTLLFYTDGLIETPGESLDLGLERLALTVERYDQLDEMCDRLLEERGEELLDDLAMVAIRRTA